MICCCEVFNGQSRIVGLDCVGVFDQGKTVVFRALRVLEDCQGRGIAKLLSKHGMEYVRDNLPGAERVRVTTLSTNEASIAVHKRQVGAWAASQPDEFCANTTVLAGISIS